MRAATPRGRRAAGWVAIEAMVGTVLLGMILTGVIAALNLTARVNRHHLAKQRGLAAAMAQLDSLSATGEPIAEADLNRLWPRVKLTLERTPGKGDWVGLTLCKAVAVADNREGPVTVALARYLPPRKEPRP